MDAIDFYTSFICHLSSHLIITHPPFIRHRFIKIKIVCVFYAWFFYHLKLMTNKWRKTNPSYTNENSLCRQFAFLPAIIKLSLKRKNSKYFLQIKNFFSLYQWFIHIYSHFFHFIRYFFLLRTSKYIYNCLFVFFK